MDKKLHFLQWHITHACNLRCIHCYQDDYQSHMPREELFRVLDQYTEYINEKGFRAQINLTGGEPLLHPDFLSLCKEIRKRDYRLGILTNGTLIDDKMASELARLHPVFVQISLDGPEEIHDRIRGTGNFQKALNGIDLLKKKDVKVLVSFTAQKQNYKSFSELAAVCQKHQVDKLWFDRVVTSTPEETERLALSTEEFRALVKTANHLRRKYRQLNVKSFVSVGRSLQAKNSRRDGAYICSAGHELLIILSNGDLMPCRRLPFIIGNVKDGPLDSIIRSSRIMSILALPRFPSGCEKCRRFPFCQGGARCVTYAQTGRLDVRDINCFYCRK